MSNIEIVRLKACIRQIFEVKWIKNDKYIKKGWEKTNAYAYETYFIEKSRLFFEKGVIFKSTYFFNRGIF